MRISSLGRTSVSLYLLLSICASTSAKTLKIISNPPGAVVELDGQAVGKTPYEQDIPSGYFQRPMTGQYWLFKSDEFHIELPRLPPSPQAAATTAFFLVQLFSF